MENKRSRALRHLNDVQASCGCIHIRLAHCRFLHFGRYHLTQLTFTISHSCGTRVRGIFSTAFIENTPLTQMPDEWLIVKVNCIGRYRTNQVILCFYNDGNMFFSRYNVPVLSRSTMTHKYRVGSQSSTHILCDPAQSDIKRSHCPTRDFLVAVLLFDVGGTTSRTGRRVTWPPQECRPLLTGTRANNAGWDGVAR